MYARRSIRRDQQWCNDVDGSAFLGTIALLQLKRSTEILGNIHPFKDLRAETSDLMNHLTQETSVGHHRFRDCENMVTKDNCEETRTTVCPYPILVKNVGLVLQ